MPLETELIPHTHTFILQALCLHGGDSFALPVSTEQTLGATPVLSLLRMEQRSGGDANVS